MDDYSDFLIEERGRVMEEKFFIRKLVKIFSEGVDKYWWFDFEKYIELASKKYDLDANKLQTLWIAE